MRRVEILKRLKDLDIERNRILTMLEASERRTLLRCMSSNYGKGCGKTFRIGSLTYIRTHWYVQPYSCSEGDYWKEGEGQFDCPACGLRNRLEDVWGFKRKKFQKLQHKFKTVVDTYDR